jgi:hypothetical protein
MTNRIHMSQKGAALLTVLLIASCSQGPSTPNATATLHRSEKGPVDRGGDGVVQGALAGDVKNGPIDINLVRVAQTDGVPAFYAYPGGEYIVKPGLPVEIYIQIWTSDPPVQNPRLIVDWGVGERDNTGCGSCRLSRTYDTEGRYRVIVTLDDRISGTTSRTFTLNVVQATKDTGLGTFNGTFSASDPQFNRRQGSFVPPATGLPCSISTNVPNYYHTYRIVHPGGSLRIETTAASLTPSISDDTFLFLYSGSFNPGNACQNNVAADDDSGGGTYLSLLQGSFPAGTYVLVVTTFEPLDTGSYTVVIQ